MFLAQPTLFIFNIFKILIISTKFEFPKNYHFYWKKAAFMNSHIEFFHCKHIILPYSAILWDVSELLRFLIWSSFCKKRSIITYITWYTLFSNLHCIICDYFFLRIFVVLFFKLNLLNFISRIFFPLYYLSI